MVNGLSGLSIRAKRAVFSDSSPFQKIEIFDTYSFGRIMCLADFVVLTELDEFIYHEALVHPAMMMHDNPARVCIIGGGDGGCLREVVKYKSVESVVVVEIDEMVKDTVAAYFPKLAAGFTDPRVSVVIDDGCSFLDKNKDTYDVIIVDSFDPGGPIQSLETMSFFDIVHSRLNKGGVAVFQLDSPTMASQNVRTAIMNISSQFEEYKPYTCTFPSFPEGICSFLVCSNTAGQVSKFNEKQYNEIAATCKYYNEDIHQGAFLLPKYIKRCMGL
jgi:spermidine synthase